MTPSETRNPATRSKSSPGVLMVTANDRPPSRISRALLQPDHILLEPDGIFGARAVQLETVDLAALRHACQGVFLPALVATGWLRRRGPGKRQYRHGLRPADAAGRDNHDAVCPRQAAHHPGSGVGHGKRQSGQEPARDEPRPPFPALQPPSGPKSLPEAACRTCGRGWFPSAASNGVRRWSASAIMAARGFPGSPTAKRPSGSSARTAGCPGRMATPSRSSRPPSAATASGSGRCRICRSLRW